MDTFAFMIHPLDTGDLSRKFKMARFLPETVKETILRYAPPFKASDITNLVSPHNSARGWFVTCPLTARQMMQLPAELVISKIISAGRKAEKLGARILGLGAFAKIVGDAGITVSKNLGIPVTTGNSYTVATALESTRLAAEIMGHTLETAQVVIVGATGAIGRVCAEIMAREVRDLTLVARDEVKLQKLANKLLYETGLAVRISGSVKKAVRSADVVLTVTSSVDTLIEPEDLKPGAVICDVSRPRNVSRSVAEQRNDILVIEGGLVEVPGDVNFNLNFGFPPKTAYACMAETMVLALEKKYESYTLGRELTVLQVEKINRLAKKHGFKVAGFRSFDKALTESEILRIKENARRMVAPTAAASEQLIKYSRNRASLLDK